MLKDKINLMVIKVVHISTTTMTVSSMTIASMMTSTMVPLMVSCMPNQTRQWVRSFRSTKSVVVLPTESFIVYMTSAIPIALRDSFNESCEG